MESFDYILPSSILSPYVKHYWALQTDELYTSERITPIGCVQLVFHRGDRMYSHTDKENQPLSLVGGQSASFRDIQSTGKTDMFVVLFQPHGAKAFFNMPVHEFHNHNVSIDDLDDVPLQGLADRIQNTSDNYVAAKLIEEFLIARLVDYDSYNHKRIASVLKDINLSHLTDIKELAATACLSHRQFNRVFSEHVGTTPKEFTRIIRFQRAVYMLQNNLNINQTELAFECGFYDQPHLIREFKTFSGYTPNEYIAICKPHSDYFTEH